jgi:hypothetical protein
MVEREHRNEVSAPVEEVQIPTVGDDDMALYVAMAS